MTRIAIISDIHLKLRKYKEFELNRFELLISHLEESNAEIIVFNGDLLDYAHPTLEEIQVLQRAFNTLHSAGKKLYLLDGNHEAVSLVSTTYDYITFHGIENPNDKYPKLLIDGVTMQLCSWSKINHLKFMDEADVLITHYRSKIDGLFDEELQTADFIDNFKLILLGDIHFRYSPAKHVFYTGCPYSTAATKPKKNNEFGYIELTLNNSEYRWSYVDLDLPQKYRIEVAYNELKDFKPLEKHMYFVRVSGAVNELNRLSNTKHIIYEKYFIDNQAASIGTPKTLKANGTFIDSLSDRVSKEVTERKREIRQILTNIQGAT